MKNPMMKKPTKPPPPPPPPPKSGGTISPARSTNLSMRINCCGGSEYAESVVSAPYSTSSLQPQMRCASPASFASCRSESGFRRDSSIQGSSSSRNCCNSIRAHCCDCSNSLSSCVGPPMSIRHFSASPCGTAHSVRSHCSASTNNCGHVASNSPCQFSSYHECGPAPCLEQHLHHNQHRDHSHSIVQPEFRALSESSRCINNNNNNNSNNNNNNVPITVSRLNYDQGRANITRTDVVDAPSPKVQPPPIPKERIVRPRMSISPLPKLKRPDDQIRLDSKELYQKCKPSQYKRHMEQHIQTLFKYLSDRESRRRNLEAELQNSEGNVDRCSLRDILKMSETYHLRSLRSKIRPDDFKFVTNIGQGFMGSVSLVEKKVGDKKMLYAMKKIKKSQVKKQNHMAHVMAERDILAEADVEWIVKLYCSFQDTQYLYFILEYLPGGDMIGLLNLRLVFNEEWARFYIAEISLAVQFVHDMGYIHRDIKPDNILIDANGHIKLTDFGLCTGNKWTHDSRYYNDDTLGAPVDMEENRTPSDEFRLDDHPTITRALTLREQEHLKRPKNLSLVGSPNYIAPEVLRLASGQQERTNEKLCDWWSVGVILYEMVVGSCPFADSPADSPEKIQYRIWHWKENLRFHDDKDRPARRNLDINGEFHELSDATKALIKGLLCDPQDRLCQNGISDIKGHPFFKGIDWANIRQTEAPHKPILKNEYDTSYFEQGHLIHEQSFTFTNDLVPFTDFTFKNFWRFSKSRSVNAQGYWP